MIHVAHVSGYADPRGRPPASLLDAWPTVLDVARSVRDAGVRVTVVQAAAEDALLVRDDIPVHFVRVSGTMRGALRVAKVVGALQPDAIHLQGIRFPLHVRALRHACPGVPILAQDHADAAPGRVRALIERAISRSPDAVLYTASEQVLPMRRSGLLRTDVPVYETPESSTTFVPGDREAARTALGVSGAPCVVWVGRLAAVKDPLTALAAFRLALDALPEARLWCAYGEAPLEPDVRAFIDADNRLRQCVTLMGALTRAQVEQLLRAADVYLAASVREGSGYALIEALACGVPPVVSDIPSFRALTRGGAIGALFPPGDAAAAAESIRRVALAADSRAAVRAHFEQHVSPVAMGERLRAAYTAQIGRAVSRRLRVCLLVPGGVDRSGTHRVIPCVLALIERLARDVDLHVLATGQEPEHAEYDLLGARVHCVPSGSRNAAVLWLLASRRRWRWDVLHALWMHPQGTAAAITGAMLRVPVLLHINGGNLAAIPAVGFGGRLSVTGRARLRVAVAGADRITAPSALVVREAAGLGIRAERLTLGVPLDRWPPAPPRARLPGEPLRLLSVGSLNRVKDHRTLLHAFGMMRTSGVNATLDCVGEDLQGGALERMAERLGVADVVRFHGFVPHAESRALFDAAHVLVVSSRYEGDPIAALEGAIAGLAVAGTAVGHLREWSPEAAAICEPGDPAGLAAVLSVLARDDAQRLRLARAAGDIAVRYDADRAAARVLEHYRELTRV